MLAVSSAFLAGEGYPSCKTETTKGGTKVNPVAGKNTVRQSTSDRFLSAT